MPTLANINFPTESALIELYQWHLTELGYLPYRHHNLMAMDEFSWCDQAELAEPNNTLQTRLRAHQALLLSGNRTAFYPEWMVSRQLEVIRQLQSG